MNSDEQLFNSIHDYSELVIMVKQWTSAIISNDVEKIGKFMSDEWIIVGETGTMNKRDFLDLIRSGDLMHHSMDDNLDRVKFYNNVAVVTGRGKNNGTYKGKAFSSDEWITDVFHKTSEGWLCVLTHLTPVK